MLSAIWYSNMFGCRCRHNMCQPYMFCWLCIFDPLGAYDTQMQTFRWEIAGGTHDVLQTLMESLPGTLHSHNQLTYLAVSIMNILHCKTSALANLLFWNYDNFHIQVFCLYNYFLMSRNSLPLLLGFRFPFWSYSQISICRSLYALYVITCCSFVTNCHDEMLHYNLISI